MRHAEPATAAMSKRERFAAALAGRETDVVPTGFWLHFPEEEWFGAAAARAHIDFYRQCDPDLLKVMNEYRYRMPEPVAGLADWQHWRPLGVRGGYYQPQLDLTARIADELDGEVPLLATIHGVYICAFHGSRRPEATFDHPHLLTAHIREDPQAVRPALAAVADTLTELALASIDAGATAIYYSSIGGEAWRFDAETFETWIKPFEVQVLQAIAARGVPIILHVCKAVPRLSSYADYPADMVNWAVHESDCDLAVGRALFGRPVLGGLDDRSGVLVDGSEADIVAAVNATISAAGRKGLILGADCTLPTDVSRERLRVAILAARAA